MFSDLFKLKGTLSINGINKALKGLSDLEEKVDKFSDTLANDFNKAGKSGQRLASTINSAFANINAIEEFNKKILASIEATNARRLAFNKESKQEIALSKEKVAGNKRELNTLRDIAKVKGQIARFGTTKERSVRAMRNRGLNQYEGAFAGPNPRGVSGSATPISAADYKALRKSWKNQYKKGSMGPMQLSAADQRRASAALQPRSGRAEIMQWERDYFKSLTPAQQMQYNKNTTREYNPRGETDRNFAGSDKVRAGAAAEQRDMALAAANARTAREQAALRSAQARVDARAKARAAAQAKIDRRLAASGGNTPADPPPGYIAPPGGFGGGGGFPPSRNPFAGGQGFGGLAEKAAAKFKSSFASMRSGLASFSQSIGNTLKLFGVFAAYDLWRTFIRGAREAINYAKEFNQEIANLNSVAKLSEPKLAEVSDSLRTMYRRTGVGSDQTEAAKGIRDLYALGYTDIDKAMAVTEQASRLSKLGFVDMDKAVQLLGSTMQAYGADASEAEKYANALLASADLGTVTMEQFATSIGRVLPYAVQTGVSIEELTSLVGVATSGSLRGETAITGLGEAFEKFSGVHRTKAAVEMLDQFGIKLDANTLKADKFIPTLKKLANEAAEAGLDLITVFSTLAGSRSGGRSLLALLDKKGGFTKLDAGYDQVKAGGQMDARQDKYLEGPQAQIDLFMSLVKDAGLQLVAQLTPAFVGLMKKLNGELRPALDTIIHNLGVMLQGFTKLLGMGGEGTLEGALKSVNDAIISVTGSLGEVKIAITVFTGIVKFLFNFVSLIGTALMGLIDTLMKAVQNPFDAKAILAEARSWNAPILEDMKDMEKAWSDVWSSGDAYQKGLAANADFMSQIKKNAVDAGKEAKAEMDSMLKNPGVAVADSLMKMAGSSWEEQSNKAKEISAKTLVTKKTKFDSLSAQEKRFLMNSLPQFKKTKAQIGIRGMLEQQISKERSSPRSLSTEKGAYDLLNKYRLPADAPKELVEKNRRDLETSIMNNDPKTIKAEQAKIDAAIAAKKKAALDAKAKAALNDPNNELEAVRKDVVNNVSKQPIDLKERIKDLQHQIKLEKISKQEGVSKWKDMLALAKEHNADLDVQRKIESQIFKLNKDITKEKTKQIKQTSDDIKIKLKTGQITPEEAMQQFGGLLKEAKADPNTDPLVTRDIVASLYNTDKKGKKDNSKKLGLQAEAELAGLNGDGLQAELLDFEAEFTKYEKFQGDKTKINELYAKKRLAIEEKYALDEAQLRQDVLNQITANKAAELRAKGEGYKADLLELKAANAQRYLDLQAQIKAWRDKGVSEIDITKFVESEKLKVIADAKVKKDAIEKPKPKSVSGSAADPRYLPAGQEDNEEVGFAFDSFSFGTGGKRSIDRKANDEAKKAALENSRHAFSLDSLKTKGMGKTGGFSTINQKTVDELAGKKEANNDTLTVILKQADAGGEREVYNKIIKKGDGSYATDNVKLGGFK